MKTLYKKIILFLCFFSIFLILAIGYMNKTLLFNQGAKNEKIEPNVSFKEIQWDDLIPEKHRKALQQPPLYLSQIEEGSFEDDISLQVQNAIEIANNDPYQQALISTDVITDMNDQAIKIPGFIVPLEFNDQQLITQFFLVPFFGACIHVPPPSPNQMIFINYPKGFHVDMLYDPFLISGILTTSMTENALGNAAYKMEMMAFEPYMQ